MKMIVKIQSVDMDAFLGRTYHPEPDHVGRFVRVVAMDEYADDLGQVAATLTGVLLTDAGADTSTVLELMEHEIEMVGEAPGLWAFRPGLEPMLLTLGRRG